MLSWKDGRRGALRQPIGTGFWFSCWSLGKLSHVVPEAFWHMPHPAAGILPSFDCSDLVIFAPECAEHLLFRSHCRDFQMFHRKNLCLIWPVEEGHMVKCCCIKGRTIHLGSITATNPSPQSENRRNSMSCPASLPTIRTALNSWQTVALVSIEVTRAPYW